MKYSLLPNPGHNRVYFEAAKNIMVNELKAVLKNTSIFNIENGATANVEYINFETGKELNGIELNSIARLSSFYALFLRLGEGCMKPVDCGSWAHFPESLNTILKYPGKTNEQFTRLILNIATSFCKSAAVGENLHLLDPMAGKGTALFEGIIHGYDVTGIEIMPKYAEEAVNYFTKYLENGRYKHKHSKESRHDAKGHKTASINTVVFAAAKEAFNNGQVQKLRFFNADAKIALQFIKKQSIDIVLPDLPYGIQHSSISNSAKSRGAGILMGSLLPSLYSVMKEGGCMVVSFNELTTKKEQLLELLNKHGFTVVDGIGSFSHRVDQAIKRDIAVCIK